MQNPRKQKREERRERIREGWQHRYAELVSGQATLAEILGYDDAKLMKLAGKGLRLLKVGKASAAQRVFRGLVVLDPWVPYFHYLLGSALEKQGHLAKAEREYGTTLELTSGVEPVPELVPFAAVGRGRVLGRMGRTEQALEALAPFSENRFAGADASLRTAASLIADHLRRQNLA